MALRWPHWPAWLIGGDVPRGLLSRDAADTPPSRHATAAMVLLPPLALGSSVVVYRFSAARLGACSCPSGSSGHRGCASCLGTPDRPSAGVRGSAPPAWRSRRCWATATPSPGGSPRRPRAFLGPQQPSPYSMPPSRKSSGAACIPPPSRTIRCWGISNPAAGFALWHLAPQSVVPSTYPGGVYSFVGGAALWGLLWGWVAWRTRSIRWTTLSHALLDFSGLGGAFYRQR